MEKPTCGKSGSHELKSPSESPAGRSAPREKSNVGRSNPPANYILEVRRAVDLAVPEAAVKGGKRREKTGKDRGVPMEFFTMMDEIR